jgi:hypothetical protein
MRKVSDDLANGGEHTESFGLSTLTGAIYGNFLFKESLWNNFDNSVTNATVRLAFRKNL